MVNKNKNLLESKETLYQDLKQCNWLLSKQASEYLESLLALEISAFSPEIDNDHREILRKIDLYKKIALYNICNRTKNLLVNNGNGIEISTVERYDHPVEFSILSNTHGKNTNSFRFNISEDNPSYIGDAIIYSSEINPILRQQELKRLEEEYQIKLNQDNPQARHDGIKRFQDENGSKWEASHQAELDKISRKISSLKGFNVDNATAEEIAAQNYLANLILEDMNLLDTDFEPAYNHGLEKTLVRKYPGMSIKRNITNL